MFPSRRRRGDGSGCPRLGQNVTRKWLWVVVTLRGGAFPCPPEASLFSLGEPTSRSHAEAAWRRLRWRFIPREGYSGLAAFYCSLLASKQTGQAKHPPAHPWPHIALSPAPLDAAWAPWDQAPPKQPRGRASQGAVRGDRVLPVPQQQPLGAENGQSNSRSCRL